MENLNELIPIQENNGKKAVSARDLHAFLQCTERFQSWFDRQLQFGFIENEDFVGCKVFNTLANQELQDYAITLNMAKEISMIQRSERGKQARKYFIACEEIATNQQQRQLSPIEMQMEMLKSMQFQLQEILQTKGEVKLLKSEVEEIKQRTITDLHCSTIVAYVTRHNIKLDVKQYPVMGRKASSLCKKRDVHISKVKDVRWGNVSVYPDDILDEVFSGN